MEGHGYNRTVSRFYTSQDADDMVPELEVVVGRLRALRSEIVGLRDAYREREASVLAQVIADSEASDGDPTTGRDHDHDPELRRLRLRMRGLVDQMQADAAWLDEREIVLRDISIGLLDLPARAGGRSVWLCWRLGEPAVTSWHPLDEGFAGRRPLRDLEGQTPIA